MPAQPSYSAHDLCQTIFIPLNCDGTVRSNEDAYVVDAVIATDTTITLQSGTISDETPDFGTLILDADGSENGPASLDYESVDRDTGVFTLSGTTQAGIVAAAGSDVTVIRSQPIVHCALTQVRLVPQVTGEVVDEDPSGQANQNVAYRRIPPQSNGYLVEADISSRENPELWALLDQYAPILDPDQPDEYLGFEEVVQTAASCPTCGGSGASCAHGVAAILVYNAWCGEDRHPTAPYVATVLRSIVFEPSTQNIVRGRGFQTRSITGTLKANTLFADPWGIDPRGAGQSARWSEILITQARIDADANLENLLTNGCGCGACPNPTLAFPAA